MSLLPRACALIASLLLAPAMAAEVTVLTAVRIHTVAPDGPAQVEAMAFDAGGRILALGSAADLRARYPDAARLDRPDDTVVPGLIDAHGHLPNLGLFLQRADLTGTASKAEILERLKAFEQQLRPGEWLLGRGWDQNDWEVKEYPTAADLDAAFPTRPVWIERIDGHAYWANSAALKASPRALDGDWQPDGGQILRDAKGRATGVFVDNATALIESQVPPLDDAGVQRMLAAALQYAVARGLTGVHDAGVSLQQLRAYQRLADKGEMPLRVYAMADGDAAALAWLCRSGPYHHAGGRLDMRSLKLYADGALGSRGAALLEDYSDQHGHKGLMVTSPAELERLSRQARGCGLQVGTHAIGDRGNRVVLDTYQKVLGADATKTDHRWRIEHAQVVAVEDIPRFAQQHVIASMQPTHATSDMPWAQARVGPRRIVGAYAWRMMRDAGVRLALGSDFPVESVDPRLGLYSAVARADADGKPAGGWRPEEKLTAYEALRGFTIDAAYAGFAEKEVGSLEAGKRADFVLLGADPLTVAPEKLRDIEVEATYVDGKRVFP